MKRILCLCLLNFSILNIYAQSKEDLRQEIARLRSDSLMQEQVIANQNHRIEQLLNKGSNLSYEINELRQDSILMAQRMEEIETKLNTATVEMQKLRELTSVKKWTQIGSDIDGEAAGDRSGCSVSQSSDGSIVAIGAYLNDVNGDKSGLVRIYQNVNGSWSQIGSDIDGEAAGDKSGSSVSLNSDGSVVAIGAPAAGHVRIYQNVNGSWRKIGSDIDVESAVYHSGSLVSLNSDGSVVAIGAPASSNDGNGEYAGHVRIYQNVNGSWSQIGSDIDGEAAWDGSGSSVSLSSDGGTVAVGACGNGGHGEYAGHVRIYQNVNGSWRKIGSDIDGEAAGDESGYSVSISSDGSTVAIGARMNDRNGEQAGHVRVFKLKYD